MIAYFLYKIAYYLAVMLPKRAGYAVATFFSILKFYLSPRDRKAVVGNLKKILPQTSEHEINDIAKEVFINFGKYLIEFFRFKFLKKSDLGGMVKVKGLEHVDNALKKGRGVIILSAHIGNWELGGVFMSLLGYPMVAVVLPHSHHMVSAFFNRQRQRLGVKVVSAYGAGIKRIYNALKDNEIVCLVGDRDFGNSGKRMPFLGATKVIPRGSAVLALRTGASIVPAFVVRQKDDTHIVEFLEPIETNGTEQEVMSRCVTVIEAGIMQYPRQWLLFREFWKE